jgi:hypothetical protein
MKAIIVSGTAIAAAAVAFALLGTTPAAAKHKPHQQKAKAGKMACNAKMACSAKMGCAGRK